ALAESRLHHLVRRRRARHGYLQSVRAGLHRPLSVAAHRRARCARRERPQRPPDARNLPGPGHRAPLSHGRQWCRPDGAALYRADPGQGADPGRTMTLRTFTVGVLAAVTAAVAVVGGRLAAHEPGDLEYIPGLDRFALAEAFRRGGEAERAALEDELAPIPGADGNAVVLGRDLDGDGDPDEIHFHLEVVEIQEEVYPGEFVTFWVFAPLGSAMGSAARLPSPTLRVEEGDRVAITLYNTPYPPHPVKQQGRRAAHPPPRGRAGQVVPLPFPRRHARHLLVSLPRAGSRAPADGACRHAHHRAQPAAQSFRPPHPGRRPDQPPGQGHPQTIPAGVFPRVHGH